MGLQENAGVSAVQARKIDEAAARENMKQVGLQRLNVMFAEWCTANGLPTVPELSVGEALWRPYRELRDGSADPDAWHIPFTFTADATSYSGSILCANSRGWADPACELHINAESHAS
jgi:hypothetical protein